jgi:hypothetical protein
VGRNSNKCGSEAQENIYMSQVGERKGKTVQSVINNMQKRACGEAAEVGNGAYPPVMGV